MYSSVSIHEAVSKCESSKTRWTSHVNIFKRVCEYVFKVVVVHHDAPT